MARRRKLSNRLRISYIAAALVAAGLALAAAAQAGREIVTPGDFAEEIEVKAALGFVSEDGTICTFGWSDPTLRERFDESDLVFAGRVGSSEILAVNEGKVEVQTLLRVGRRFKGVVRDDFVIYRYSLPVRAFGPEAKALPELTPGSMVLAFLNLADDEAGRLVFEAAGDVSGVRGVPLDEIAAYCELLEGLAGLERSSEKLGEPDPTGLMEWRVAAAENPFTRKEGTSLEILWELRRLEAFAYGPLNIEATDTPELGAKLTEDQKVRLVSALFATETMRYADLDLFRLVRNLDPEAATRWLTETLRFGVIPEGGDIRWRLEEFAETLPEGKAKAFLHAAKKQIKAIDKFFPGDDASPEAREAWERQRTDLALTLFAELADLLAIAG